ncbi:ubiquitin carboxyl-terminal hydrolase 23-like isoform X2 [Carya illinoinensis]|uniref:ubiquitin carboxyl-terminal hydrolase 23-like isoform X2 n=1 Tax=Carya illinoinensis TaxID=32201 RepID=UPI001C71FC49|nr:ubiquitin carboxyl-terminal hydrolase 23-like isoform X2 [Carya illinoinensis]
MAGSFIASLGSEARSESPSTSKNGPPSLFHKRIGFHPARKPFKSFGNGGGGSDQRRSGSSAGQWGLAGKKGDGYEFLDNGLDPELSFGITVRRIGAGLKNLGNTCFLNSVLQCLTYTEPLAAYLQSSKHQNSCHIAGFCVLCAIQKHVSCALQSTGRILAPNDFVRNLQCISRNFRKARQEDAHEYMVNLLESMHKCCLPSGVPSESPTACENSLVYKIFGGRLRSQVKCLQCSYCSNTFDPFLDLSLEIVKADSLNKALANFTAAEQLDGGERQYQCQHCKQKVRALKQLTVHKAPYVLTVHLKRFHSYDPGQKIKKKVHFGSTLDLKPFVSGSYDGDLKYTLYGVLVHDGWNTHYGHYSCYVRTSNGIWYHLNDNQVAQASEKRVLEQQAYMLFYVRDRRKSSTDVFQKENLRGNANGIRTSSTFNQDLKEMVKTSPVENRLSGATSATVVTRNDASNICPPRMPLLKEASVQKSDCLIMTECSVLGKGSVSEPLLKAPLLNTPLEVLPATDLNSREFLSISAPSGNGVAPDIGKTAGGIINNQKVSRSSSKDSRASVSTSPNFSDPQSSSTAKLVTDETCQKINLFLHVAPSGNLNDKIMNAIDPVGNTPNEGAVCNLRVEDAGDRVKKIQRNESVNLSSSSIKANRLQTEVHNCKHDRKWKKKLLKYRAVSVRLNSHFLFHASLRLWKKKKHKRNKRCTLDVRNLSRANLLDTDSTSTDLGPSTSESTRTITFLAQPLRKGTKSGSQRGANNAATLDLMTSSGDCFMENVIDGEFRYNIDQCGTVLATDKQLGKSSFLDQRESGRLDGPKDGKRKVVQNGLMSMLTRVARWDGIELPPSQIAASNGIKSISIGYMPDEWDEEYDGGKREKVRQSKHSFGGPNPFQETATKKSQTKKARLDRSSSGNEPFRI